MAVSSKNTERHSEDSLSYSVFYYPVLFGGNQVYQYLSIYNTLLLTLEVTLT